MEQSNPKLREINSRTIHEKAFPCRLSVIAFTFSYLKQFMFYRFNVAIKNHFSSLACLQTTSKQSMLFMLKIMILALLRKPVTIC
jgi:hypothetical protein